MSWEEAAAREVREHLWRLIGKVRRTSSHSWSEFNNLATLDAESAVLRSRLAVLRVIDTEAFITSLEMVVRGLPNSIDFRTSVDSRGPYGRIRWAETTVTRVRSGNPELVVHSQVIRDYDRPLNRAVKSTLLALVEILDAAERASRLFGPAETVHEFLGETRESLEELQSRVLILLESPKISGARAIDSVGEELWERLVERGGHECMLDPAFQRAFTLDPPLRDVIDLLIRDLAQPSRVSDLMELMVSARLTRALEQLGLTLLPLHLRRPRQPFASLLHASGERWEVHWQSSPWVVPSLGWDRESSAYSATRVANGLGPASLRPDCLVVGPDQRAILVEVKFTEGDSPRYRDAILDAMAYLRDTDVYTSEGSGPKVIAVVRHATANWDGSSPIAVSDGELTSLTKFIEHFWADRLATCEPIEVASA